MSLRRTDSVRRLIAAFALLALLGLACPPLLAQPVIVDGDLSDWDAFTPHGVALDACNELFPLCKSGFDFTRVLVHYDQATDTLFFGIDPMDVEDGGGCQGIAGPGVPGDADGDLDPCTDGNLPTCPINLDQECVGPDEQYLLKIDTNFDGDFTDLEDIRVVYRGNQLRFEQGNGNPFPWSGEVMLGMAGAQKTCICANENPDTEDIEIAVHNFSQLDPVPTCFIVDAIAGSLVDIPPEDFLDAPIFVSIATPDISLAKRVRNVTQGTPFNSLGTGANIGDTVEFEIVVTNTGNITLDPTTVTDNIKAGFANPVLTSGPGCSIVGQNLTCNLGMLAPAASVTITYQAQVASGASGILRNMGVVTATALEEGTGPICGGEVVTDNDDTRVVVHKLVCDKLVSLDGVNFFPSVNAVPGQTVTFKVSVTNPSFAPLPTVTFSDTLPAGYTNIVSLDGRVVVSGQTLSSPNIGPLANQGGSTEVLYQADIAPAASGTLVNTAMINGTAQDGTSTATSCSADVDVVEPAIECEKLVSLDGINYVPNTSAVPGQRLYFRVTVSNTGTADLYTASAMDTLPAAFSNIIVTQGACNVVGQVVQCDEIGPIAAGGQVVIEYNAEFNATSGVHTNLMFVNGTAGTPGNPGDTVSSNCSSSVTGLDPDILCIKGVSTTLGNYGPSVEAAKGQTVYFEVQVVNSGNATLFDAAVQDVLPAGLINPAIVSGNCTINGSTIDCTTGPLAPAQIATIVYSAVVGVENANLVNNVTVTGMPGTVGNPGDVVASGCSATVVSPDVEIICDKLISTDGVNYFPTADLITGQTAYFRVTVTNNGAARLETVMLDDVLPTGYANILVTTGATCSVNGQTVHCDQLGPLDPGQSSIVEYQATVTATNPPIEMLVNTAMVTGTPGTGQNPGDDVTSECSAIANIISPSVVCEKQVSIDGVTFLDQVSASTGQVVLFRVTVTNDSSGPVTLDPVQVIDALPGGYTNVMIVSGSCNVVGNVVQCDVGPLAEGESAEILYRAKIAATSGSLVNTATIQATHAGGDIVTDCSATVDVIENSIVCTKEVSKDGVTFKDSIGIAPGQLAWYRVTISNDGDSDFFTHTLNDVIPAGLTDVTILQGPGCVVAGGNTISCADLGPLPAGGPDTVILYQARLVATSGPLVNTAQITATPGTETNPGTVLSTSCPATVNVQTPEIICEKSVSLYPDMGFGPSVTAAPGMNVYFRIITTNTGESHFLSVNLDDIVPAGLGNVQIIEGNCTINGNTLDCDLGSMPRNSDPVSVVFAAEVIATTPQTLVNTATVTAIPGTVPQNPGTPVSSICDAQVVIGTPNIECEKSATPENPVTGQTITFTVTARNTGDVNLVDVMVEDTVDPLAFDQIQIVEGSCAVVANQISCNLNSLAPGEEETVIFTARLIATSGTASNTATVTANPGVQGNTGTPVQSTCPVDLELLAPDIACDKNVSLDGITFADDVVAEPGDTVYFEVLVSNTGDACFHEVQIDDVLPDGYENVQIIEGVGCTVNGNTIECADLGQLCPADAPIRIVYRATVRVSPPPTETLVNTVTVTGIPGEESNPGDPVTSECSASVSPIRISIECDKTANPNFAVTGQAIEYTVVITNTSEDDVTFDSVSFVDTLPEGLANIQMIEPATGCTIDEGLRTIVCDDLGTLAQGASFNLRYTAEVTATNPPTGSLTNNVLVTANAGELETMSQCSDTVFLGQPEVICVKGATVVVGGSYNDSAEAIPGQRVYFEVLVQNTGDVPFYTGTLIDTLPAGFTDVIVETAGCVVSGLTVSCADLGPIGVGETVAVRFSARVTDNPPADPLVNTADITATPGTAGNPGTTLASSCSVPITILTPNIECQKLVSADGVNFFPAIQMVPGQTVYFRIVVTNTGEGRYYGVTVTDVLNPQFFESPVTLDPGICAFNGLTLECGFGPLKAGETQELNFQAMVKSTASGSVTNLVDIVGLSGTVPNPGLTVASQCTAQVQMATPGIDCDKQISKDGVNFSSSINVQPGDHVFFRVTVTNTGTTDLRNVTVEDPIPAGYVNVTTSTAGCAFAGGTLSCTLGDFAPAQQVVVQYEADVAGNAAGPLINTATIAAETGTDANPGDPVGTSCSATADAGPLEIPTLSEIGMLILALLLGATLILHQNRR